ncbi:MAG: beta-glucosidase [Aestuariivirga sp.]|uniref:glucoamylase family protein n=1 Tax=Aestuariivirga sp. TaxID=2650926 RepID=UPI0025C060C3|nr:glucoamylase family protein [Aestuariivirga sp.]MCA3562226.1 beta-glucosidase [Aestuariivirga sp.]
MGRLTLLDKVQMETLRYFTDFAHPESGMARERFGTPGMLDTVTTGGTGFGIMAMMAGVRRHFLGAEHAAAQITRICEFLLSAPRYRGAFAHWMNGNSGATVSFSPQDDGGDIVETAFLVMGLITARQYLGGSAPRLTRLIDELWRGVDWAGYCPSPGAMMWHWSPRHGFGMGLELRGWHEALVAFVLGAGSPTHSIDPRAYWLGWKNSPTYRNGQSYYRIYLPLGPAMGGPLFFSHYSFLGLDPRGLEDDGLSFFGQNRAQVRINRAHCMANPHGFAGYGKDCWGLTSCDGPHGYEAFAPAHDKGVIAPTAALASMPYLPHAALAALSHFNRYQDGALWGDYGFRDAFCPQEGWVAESHLAINQGPIVAMIENHRSGLLWQLFMSAPEVRAGLSRLGIRYHGWRAA